jgi:hypothetical protein
MLQQWRVGDDSDVKPVALLGKELGERLKLEVGLLDLCVVEGVTHPVFDASKVTVELLAAILLADLLKQLGVVLTGPHPTVSTRMDVRHVEHRYRAFYVVADLNYLFHRPP